MVTVIMGNNQVIDTAQFRLARHHLDNPVRVSQARIPGVHQDGLSGGSHDQRGCSALHIYPVNIEPAVLGTRFNRLQIQQQSQQAYHITNTEAVQAQGSFFSSVNLDLGGELVRNNLNVLMGGEGAGCMLNGLYMVTGSQHVDNQVIIDHAKGHTTARELYKGILDGKSRSVFHGSIIVREGAVKVDSEQADKNLLLSDQAEADTKPAFWVYCDDVRCIHGAACGQIDENALFYLRSRGLSEQAARRFLTRGFATEVVDSIEYEPYRTHVHGLVQGILHEWLGGEEMT